MKNITVAELIRYAIGTYVTLQEEKGVDQKICIVGADDEVLKEIQVP